MLSEDAKVYNEEVRAVHGQLEYGNCAAVTSCVWTGAAQHVAAAGGAAAPILLRRQ